LNRNIMLHDMNTVTTSQGKLVIRGRKVFYGENKSFNIKSTY